MDLTAGLRRSLQQTPDAVATICGARRQTFRQLGARIQALAGALTGLGLKPGGRVAILALNSDRYLEYFLAVFWAGGVIVPVNIRWSEREIALCLADCGAEFLFADDQFAEIATRIRSQVPSLHHLIHIGGGPAPGGMIAYEPLIAEAAPLERVPAEGTDLAALFYTGGTTGLPKGVMLSHGNLWSSAMSFMGEGLLRPGSVCLHAAPMFHVGDFAFTAGQLIRGGAHVFVPGFSPQAVMAAIAEAGVTDLLLVPTMIQMLLDHPRFADFEMGSLRRILFGAAPISGGLLDRALEALPQVEFMHGYGMTETAPLITVNPPWYYSAEGRHAGKIASAGRASYCVEVRIVDEADAELPRGTIGEIVVRGPNVMMGYWNRPAETAAALRGGWMHTGDAGYMDEDGFVFIVDRVKDMIISGGENIYSLEVETALSRHEAVAACAVVGVPDERWGETVHAVIVLKSGASASPDALIAHCRELIAGYKCPRSIEFRDALPLSGAGKVMKTALRPK